MRVFALLSVALLLAAAGVTAATPGSHFLNAHAADVSQIVDQVESNRLVALRYARHFGVEPSSVLQYIKTELGVSTLGEDTSLDVYTIDESRNIVRSTVLLKAGAKVFANSKGVPVLTYGTGNPMTATLRSDSVLATR